MSYNSEFFEMYQSYLQEFTVKTVHRDMIRSFWQLLDHRIFERNVLDLGCGTCEWWSHGNWDTYVGVDIDPRPSHKHIKTISGDYTKIHPLDLYDKSRDEHNVQPTIFVSLFSTEACLSADEKYKLYDKLFSGCLGNTTLAGCVSGFYYKGKEDQEKVSENGGIESYQTIEDQKKYYNPFFREYRTHIGVPSKMFGDNVVEVWKYFIKNTL